jgi:hypothetical protein
MNTEDPLLQQLLAQGERLSPDVRRAFLARGAEAVPLLVHVLEDEQLALTTAPGEGYAPIHAAALLAELGGPQALRAMVHALSRSEPGLILFDVLLSGLKELGAEMVPAALETLEVTDTPDGRLGLLSALAQSGVKDERIFQHLLKFLETEPESAAMDLAEYGDPRAIEPLQRAFDRVAQAPVEEGLLAGHELVEIEAAIEELGGTLSESQREKLEQATASRRAIAAQFQLLLEQASKQARRPERPGRNEPCWCGSGVKYKKCHAASDRAT